MNTKSEIIAALAQIAPSIALETIWERDEDAKWDVEGTDLDPDNFDCWQSEVKATAIVRGKIISGSDYMGGTWEKIGDQPEESNPNISGYFPQMARAAIVELAGIPAPGSPLHRECEAALGAIDTISQAEYAEQMAK